MNLLTFKYLCNLLRLVWKKKDTHLSDSILVEYRVTIILCCLESGNTLIIVAKLFGLRENTISKIMNK